MTDDKWIKSKGSPRGVLAFFGGMAFFLAGLAAKVALIHAAGRRA